MKTIFKATFPLLAITLLISCAGPQGEKAQTGDANAVTVTTGDVTLKVDNAASTIAWTGTKPTGQHHGKISISDGSLMLTDGKLIGGKFVIDMNSIVDHDLNDAGDNAKLVGHLKSPDFFDVSQFPIATFEITSVSEAAGADGSTHSITGNLTMKDVTRSVTLPATVKIEGNAVVASTPEFLIDRTQWNVQYGSKSIFDNLKDKFINDEIGLKIDLKASI